MDQINFGQPSSGLSRRRRGRKIAPKDLIQNLSLEERIWKLQEVSCQGKAKQYNDKNEGESSWIFNEYFYPHCDSTFYLQHPMKEIIKIFSDLKPLNLKNWKKIHKALPKPEKFTPKLIQKERIKLEQKRKKQFIMGSNVSDKQIKIEDYLNDIKLTAGVEVWAMNPSCGHLHPGTVLTQYKDDIFVIKFKDSHLGTLKIREEFISSDFLKIQATDKFPKNPIQNHLITSNHDLHDFEAFAMFRCLLEIKGRLLKQMKSYHDVAQRRRRSQNEGLNEVEIQEYGWIGSIIALVNIIIKYLEVNYSIIGSHHQHNPKKSSKIPFLKFSNQYVKNDNASQDEDDNESEGQASKNYSFDKNQQESENTDKNSYLQTIYRKYEPLLEEGRSKAEIEELRRLLKNCIGVLCGVQQEGKRFNLKDKFMKDLQTSLQGESHLQFYSINSHLEELITKLS